MKENYSVKKQTRLVKSKNKFLFCFMASFNIPSSYISSVSEITSISERRIWGWMIVLSYCFQEEVFLDVSCTSLPLFLSLSIYKTIYRRTNAYFCFCRSQYGAMKVEDCDCDWIYGFERLYYYISSYGWYLHR